MLLPLIEDAPEALLPYDWASMTLFSVSMFVHSVTSVTNLLYIIKLSHATQRNVRCDRITVENLVNHTPFNRMMTTSKLGGFDSS